MPDKDIYFSRIGASLDFPLSIISFGVGAPLIAAHEVATVRIFCCADLPGDKTWLESVAPLKNVSLTRKTANIR